MSLAFLTVGLWGGAGGTYAAHQDRTLVSTGAHSTATVSDVEFAAYRSGRTSAIMTVPFVAADGRQYSTEARERYRERRDGPKDEFAAALEERELTVFYDPTDPDKSVVEGQERPYAGPIILLILPGGLGAFGYLVTIFGFIGLHQAQKNRQAPSNS